MSSPAAIYRFGPYELRTRTRELYKNGGRLKLRPQPFQILQALMERWGDVVTREELLQRLWPRKVEPGFDSLRRDPRFQDLLNRAHLAL